MANCKNCLHGDVCFTVLDTIQCQHFKDRARFLELPCRVGDMLELFEEFFELGADALDRLCQENSWADYPDEGIDEQNYRYRELGQIFLENLQEKRGF